MFQQAILKVFVDREENPRSLAHSCGLNNGRIRTTTSEEQYHEKKLGCQAPVQK